MLRLTAAESAIMEKFPREEHTRSKQSCLEVAIFNIKIGLSRSWKPRISQSYCVWRCESRISSGASQGAQIVFMCGNDMAIPITWKSKKLERVTKSQMASETMALAESADAGHFVLLVTKEIFGLKTAPRVICKTDNKSFEEHLKSSNVI